MSSLAKSFCAAMLCLALQPAPGRTEGIDTEHIYGFMIGTDVGERGEREFQTETTGRFSRQAGTYQAVGQQLELEFVPINNFRVEIGTTLAAHNIEQVPGFLDRTQANWQGASLDLRYRFLNRDSALNTKLNRVPCAGCLNSGGNVPVRELGFSMNIVTPAARA